MLRWRAPLSAGELTVRARLTVGGVVRELSAKIRVVPEPSGGEVFTDALEIWREGREAPVDPERVKDFPPRSLGIRPIPTYAAALAAATAYVDGRFDESQRAAWAEFLTVQDPEVIDDVLVTAFASNHAVAALAIALRGHELAPNDPVHLSNAAVAANGLDRPEWAIAFRAPGRRPPARSRRGRRPGGGAAHQRRSRVGADGRLRQRRAAPAPRAAARPGEPLVHEELAAVVQFRGGKEAALPHVRRSLRKTDDPDPLEDHADNAPYRFSRAPASQIFDLSRGLRGGLTLPGAPRHPRGAVGGRRLDGLLGPAGGRLFARLQATQREIGTTIAQLRDEDLHPISRQRISDVIRHIGSDGDLAVAEAYAEFDEAHDRVMSPNGCQDVFPNHAYCDYNGTETSCGSSRVVFAEWRVRTGRWYDAIRDYHRVAWPVFTGLQAQLSNPVAFKLAGLQAQANLLQKMYHAAINVNATGFAMPREEGCDGSDPLDDPQQADLDDADPAACAPDSGISKLAFEVDLLVTKFKASCEKFSLESSLGAYGFLEGYAKYEQGWKANGATIFVGGKAQIPSVASFDSVVYLETDGQGGVKDVGLEVGPEVELGGSIKLDDVLGQDPDERDERLRGGVTGSTEAEAEGMAGGVEEDPEGLAGLVLGQRGAEGEDLRLGGVEVLDDDVEVELLRHLLARPRRRPVVLDPLEGQALVLGPDVDPVLVRLDRPVEQRAVERRQGGGIGTVEHDAREPCDGHGPTLRRTRPGRRPRHRDRAARDERVGLVEQPRPAEPQKPSTYVAAALRTSSGRPHSGLPGGPWAGCRGSRSGACSPACTPGRCP